MTRLCHLDELPDTSARGFDPTASGQDTVFVVRHGQQLRAWRDACPHVAGAPLAWRRHAYLSADGQHIVCSAHGARFDPDTGQCVLGPALGQRLSPVAITLQPNGELHLAPTPLSDLETST